MCKHGQSLIFDVFKSKCFWLGSQLRTYLNSVGRRIFGNLFEVFQNCANYSRRVCDSWKRWATRQWWFRQNTHKTFPSKSLVQILQILISWSTASNFFGDALFYWAIRMTWVVQLSSKGQESLMTVVKIFHGFGGMLDRDYRTSVYQHFIRQSQPRRKQDSSKSDDVP